MKTNGRTSRGTTGSRALPFPGCSAGNGPSMPLSSASPASSDPTGRALRDVDRALEAMDRDLGRAVDGPGRAATDPGLHEIFAHAISHDLGAPLRAVDGFSLVLLEEYGDRLEGPGRDYLKRIRAAARQMSERMDDLLDLSRIAREGLEWRVLDLTRLAEEVAEEISVAHPGRSVRLSVEPDLRVVGDESLLRLALRNLLANAWKFTAGRERARIDIGRSAARGPGLRGGSRPRLDLFVRDNGVGFDPADAEKIFQAFERSPEATGFDGTGLGLFLVRRAVRRHGGNVWAEGRPASGATFYVRLPAAPASATSAAGGDVVEAGGRLSVVALRSSSGRRAAEAGSRG